MADFLMPALGADMERGKLVQWLVREGELVHSGQIVAVVETHKGAIDVEIFLDGAISAMAPLGSELRVGEPLARVGAEPAPPQQAARWTSASPAARRRARELGIALEAIAIPAAGAIRLADVERAASAGVPPEPASASRRGFDPAQMREAIAASMSRSKREIPHYYLGQTLDFDAARRWLDAYNLGRDPEDRLLPAVLLLKATALALREFPRFNGWYQDGVFRPGDRIDVGWAVALRGDGLIAPAIHDADRLALPELMQALRDLVQRARSGGLRSSELSDPTVTLTSLGERGAESVWGVIYPPQVAILGFGRIFERPWVVDGRVVARPLVSASLAADHRVSDGHQGGLLLAAIERVLQSPQAL